MIVCQLGERHICQFLSGQSPVIHPDGIVGYIVELRFLRIFIVIHAQISYITPWWLIIIRRPVGKSARNSDTAAFACFNIDTLTTILLLRIEFH